MSKVLALINKRMYFSPALFDAMTLFPATKTYESVLELKRWWAWVHRRRHGEVADQSAISGWTDRGTVSDTATDDFLQRDYRHTYMRYTDISTRMSNLITMNSRDFYEVKVVLHIVTAKSKIN